MRRIGYGIIEPLEDRRLLSASGTSATDVPPLTAPFLQTATLATLPNVKRTYSGTYRDGSLVVQVTLKIRKQDSRGSLRGTFTAVTNLYGTVTGEITYGKVQSNLRVRITIEGTIDKKSYTATIFAKASTSGSQIKGDFSFSGLGFSTDGPFLVKKA